MPMLPVTESLHGPQVQIGAGAILDPCRGTLVLVEEGVSVVSTAATAIADHDRNLDVTVLGMVAGATGGIRLSGRIGHDVTVGATGSVIAWNGTGIEIAGTNASLTNLGLVRSDVAEAVAFRGCAGGMLTNAGTIAQSGTPGAGAISLGGADVVMVNSGLVTSSSRVSAAVSIATGNSDNLWSARLVNLGDIVGPAGAVSGSDGIETVVNTGRITGDIDLGGGDDILRNDAWIGGDVRLGSGTDAYAGRGGIVTGAVLGGDGRDRLIGGAGADRLSGECGGDLLRGGEGDDSLLGGGGADRLQGGGGNDRLDAGAGDDILTGGDGADIFVFRRMSGESVVTDFTDGSDLIDLGAFGLADFSALAPFLTEAVSDALRIDLAGLGGTGSVLVQGLAHAAADAADFLL